MSRAEQRRRDKADKKDRKRAEAILKQMGFPEFQMPPAPMRTNKLSIQEVSNLTGTKVAVLEQWRKEQIEEIKKACIVESQERLDVAENFITLSNVIASLKALDGFRYAKLAALHMLKHFNDCIESVKEENVQQTYKELHEKWGLEIEFDVPELNQIMGFDAVDWRQEYIGKNVPVSVIDKIANDAKNIQSVETQIAVLWELCKEFGFAKHKKGAGSMLDKFMRGTKEKYDKIDTENRGVSKALKMLREKYEIDISWTENTMRTIERFDL